MTRQRKRPPTKEEEIRMAAHNIVHRHADADMCFEEILMLLLTNGVEEKIARKVALEVRPDGPA